ncbi:MAG: glycoprotein, partial [Rhodococcus sp.]|nr:glycoprotein [Rhodococcus sp. (in: high G+C Gram-positive bacteria)]
MLRSVEVSRLATLMVLASVLAVLVGGAVLTGPAPAAATPASHTQNTQDTTQQPQFLQLHIDEVTPTVVTTGSPATLTVSGRVENIGDRSVEDISVRLQRGPEIASSDALRTSLTMDQARYDTVGRFETVSDGLDRGEEAPFTLTMPFAASTGSNPEPALNITSPGVYPVLVNVNGTPDYGG